MANRSKEESQEALLDAALDIFMENLKTEDSLMAALSSVSFPKMAERAGYKGPGIAYYVWDQTGDRSASRRAFEADLLQRIVDVAVENTGVAIDPNLDIGPSDLQRLTLVDALARSTWQATTDSATWRFYEVLMSLRGVERVNSVFGRSEVAALDELATIVESVMPLMGRRFLPGFNAKQGVLVTRALMSGMLAATDLNPDYANYDEIEVEGMDQPVSLLGYTMRSILDGMTEPLST